MKILFIHNYYRIVGGEETYVNSLSRLFIKKKHKIVKFEKDSKKIKNFFQRIQTALALFYSQKIDRELSTLIEKEKPEIAQFFNIFPLISPTAYYVCKKYNIPIVQRISSYRYLCPKGTLFLNYKICTLCINKRLKLPAVLNKCYADSAVSSLFFLMSFYFHKEIIKSFNLVDLFYFPTEFIKEQYIKYANIDKKKTAVIPTFTDIPIKNLQVNKLDKKIIPYKNKYFLFVGRLVIEKGIINLIRAFKSIKNQKLVIIGEGELKNFVMNESKKNTNIIYLPRLSWINTLSYIKFSKAVILPSIWYDVLPNVFLEALFLDRPIILSDIPSLRFIRGGKGIIKFKFNSIMSLQKAIQKTILKEPSTDYTEIKNKFSAEQHYSKIMKVYSSLC